jgi:ubiquinone/menaquinone biosynthesis C-methylase UbiE
MDSAEEARDYDAMDHAAVNRAFVADFLATWDGATPILDAGTGTAQIPIELCRQAPNARVVAFDLAGHMLQLARENVRRAALEERIHIERCDVKSLPFVTDTFGSLISNSIIHHVPDPGSAVSEMFRVVRPGSLLFIRDLLRPADEPALAQLVHAYAGSANSHQRQMFADSLRAALTLAEARSLFAAFAADPKDVQQTSDRHWTFTGRKPTASEIAAANASPR